MTGRCIAYLEDGRICGAPATVIDPARGGVVCSTHAPPVAPRPLSFTPGPWGLEEGTRSSEGDPLIVTDSQGYLNIARAEYCDPNGLGTKNHEIARANARLIAAAPELYEALRELAAVACKVMPRGVSGGPYMDALDKASAALAKAEGREP